MNEQQLADKLVTIMERWEKDDNYQAIEVLADVRSLLAAASPGTQGVSEVAWLIERGGLCLGFCEYRFAWVTFTDENALRLSRKEDAYALKECLKENTKLKMWDALHDAIVTEHMWTGPAALHPSGQGAPATGTVLLFSGETIGDPEKFPDGGGITFASVEDRKKCELLLAAIRREASGQASEKEKP